MTTSERPLTLGAASLIVAWVVVLPIDAAPFGAHMAAHMIVVAVAAPLIALGLRGTAIEVAAPSAIAASMIELFVVWVWHAPALHAAASGSVAVLALEQAAFLAAGLTLWMAALRALDDRELAPASVVALLTTSMHMTLLGALLALTPRRLFTHEVACDPWIHPVHDQQIGGAIMIVLGGGVYLAGGLWLTARVLWPRPRGSVSR